MGFHNVLASAPAFAYDDCHLDAGWQTFRPPEFLLPTFGENLRKQREQRGLSLDAISTITKISPRMLRAIEEEHFEQLPGGVFNKGFVRAYARLVGLDEDEAVSDYLAALRESQIQSQTILPNFRNSTTETAEDDEDRRRINTDAGGTHLRNRDHAASARVDRAINNHSIDPPPDRRLHQEDRRKEARRSDDREARPQNHSNLDPNSHDPSSQDPSNKDLDSRVPIGRDQSGEVRANGDHPQPTVDGYVPAPPLSFLNLTSTPSSRPIEEVSRPLVNEPDGRTHPVPWGKLAAALLVITLILAFWTLRRRNQTSEAAQPLTSSSVPSSTESATSRAPVSTAVPTAVSAKPTPAATHGNRPPVSTAAATAAPVAAAAAVPADADVNPPVPKPRSQVVAPKPPRAFTLLIRADQTSWVSIIADGQPVAKETLIAPANTSVRANHDITVRAGNAAGISFMLDGKEIPAQGSPGEVRTFTFDATGLRSSAVAQPTNPTP
ncbi:MAG: helix-turn-helix domain-containing protein [Candidatus Sulfotelmatobacter sp.]